MQDVDVGTSLELGDIQGLLGVRGEQEQADPPRQTLEKDVLSGKVGCGMSVA